MIIQISVMTIVRNIFLFISKDLQYFFDQCMFLYQRDNLRSSSTDASYLNANHSNKQGSSSRHRTSVLTGILISREIHPSMVTGVSGERKTQLDLKIKRFLKALSTDRLKCLRQAMKDTCEMEEKKKLANAL